MLNDDVADFLDRAAEVIEAEGWWGHEILTHRPNAAMSGHCALTALATPLCEAGRNGRETYIKARRLLARECGGSVITWNDTPGRTAEEVIDKLRTVAKEVRNGTLVP
jgi:hypothetical protein